MKEGFEKLLGEKISFFRRKAEMTQQELAEGIRVAPETISRLETGAFSPSLKTLMKISEVLGVEVMDLFDFQQKSLNEDQDLKRLINVLKGRSPNEIKRIHRIVKEVLDFKN